MLGTTTPPFSPARLAGERTKSGNDTGRSNGREICQIAPRYLTRKEKEHASDIPNVRNAAQIVFYNQIHASLAARLDIKSAFGERLGRQWSE